MSKMKLVEKLRQKPVVERIEEMSLKGLGASPYVVELDPTSACDLACPGCISGELLNKEKFSRERLLALSKELVEAGVKAVILIGGGEPLTHPAIGQVIEYFGSNNIQIGITTNGTLIDRYLTPISEYVDWTRVSVDAATDETFKYLRPTRSNTSKFSKVISNMELLAKHKRGILGYSFLIRTNADGDNSFIAGESYGIGKISQSNVMEIYAAAKLAKEIGCDYFEPKPSYDSNHCLVVHDSDEMKKAEEQLLLAQELEDDTFKVIESVNLRHSFKSIQMEPQPKEYTTCPSAKMRTLITPSGVYVCPYFRGNPEKKVGDVTSASFADMWNGEKREEVMNQLNPSKDCGMHCIRHETNLEIFKIQSSLLKSDPQEIKVVEDKPYDLFI